MLQADHVVHNGNHRLTGHFGVAVGHSHRDLFVIAKDDFRLVVAAVVNDGVMDTAKRCARVKCGVLDIKSFHQIDNDV
jgi:hypothetical protein